MNGTTTFMGGAVVIPVIMEILTDFLARPVSDSRHDTDTTKPNAPRLIYLARWNTKQTNKQTRAALFLSIHF